MRVKLQSIQTNFSFETMEYIVPMTQPKHRTDIVSMTIEFL